METIRSFIAIELDETVQETIATIEEELKKTGADVKWVKPRHIHLTLKFLGSIPFDQAESILAVIQTVAQSHSSFSFQLTRLGAFPKMENPRVIWLGIEEGKEQIRKIVLSLEEKLEKVGFKKEEREFDPHVTIGRVRSPLNRFALSKAMKEIRIAPAISQAVTQITLFKSALTPQGPLYEALKRISLKT